MADVEVKAGQVWAHREMPERTRTVIVVDEGGDYVTTDLRAWPDSPPLRTETGVRHLTSLFRLIRDEHGNEVSR